MKNFIFIFITLFIKFQIYSQVYLFNGISETPQSQSLVLPNTHTFQKIAQENDTLFNVVIKGHADFTGFVPTLNSSVIGTLSLSHEQWPASVTVFGITLSSQNKWQINDVGTIDFSDVIAAISLCSGNVTNWGTVVVAEEAATSSDNDNNGYHDFGWLIEIDPITKKVVDHDGDLIGEKLWKLGKTQHENICFLNDTVAYFGADHGTEGYLYKFISDSSENFLNGDLFVFKNDTIGIGQWFPVPNTTPTECNNSSIYATSIGATNFAGIEDCEIGPDGNVYFAAKHSGRVYKLNELTDSTANVDLYVENTQYNLGGDANNQLVTWGIGADNLAFDNAGNLWVLQDGGQNNIWVVRNGHTPSSPNIELFATTPIGSEPTGITFTPDNTFIFLSIQHPDTLNTVSQVDAKGDNIVFNRSTTIVIGRNESFQSTTEITKQNDMWWHWNRKLYFGINSSSLLTIEIFDNLGRLVFSKTSVSNATFTLPSHLRGLFIVKVTDNENKSHTNKIFLD